MRRRKGFAPADDFEKEGIPGMTFDEIFRAYRSGSGEISLDEMRKNLSGYGDKIVLYGAGSAGIAFLHYLRDAGVEPRFFADGDPEKHGTLCEGLEILPPGDIVKKAGPDALVIVTINTDGQHYCRDFKAALLAGGHQGVHAALAEAGCRHVIDYAYFRKCFSMFRGGRYNLPACSDVALMAEHEAELRQAYDLLEDQASREVFLGILEFRMLNDDVDILTVSEEKQYFEYDLFAKTGKDAFVDCGACGGSSLKIFLRENEGRFARYYGIEPDPRNFEQLKGYVAGLPREYREKMELIPKAAYDRNGETPFFVLNGPGTFASEAGPQQVETVKIDDVLRGRPASYIKMNIEGSEIPALKGAEQTIRRYGPYLAVMGYHKTGDMWEVPLLMRAYRPDYRIFLRSYMKNVAFCYYAVI